MNVATATVLRSKGTGDFSNNSSLTLNYTPSSAGIKTGSVDFYLSTTAQGTCNPVSNTMIVSFSPIPVVSAGADRSVCANNASVSLAGTVTIAAGGLWSSNGTGTFTPNATTLNAVYTPSAADKTAGT